MRIARMKRRVMRYFHSTIGYDIQSSTAGFGCSTPSELATSTYTVIFVVFSLLF